MITTSELFSDYDVEDGFPDTIMDNRTPVTCRGCGALVNPVFTDEHVSFHETVHDLYLVGRA